MASKIKVDQIQTADGSGTIALQNQLSGMTTASLPALGSAQMPTGSVLQVVTLADTSSVSGTSQITSSGVSITPSSSSNKVLLLFNMAIETNSGGGGGTDRGIACKLFRDSTEIYSQPYEFYSSARGSGDQQIGNVTYTMLDSPASTSSVTYKFKLTPTSGTARMNEYGDSFLTLMEIAG